MVSLVQGHDDTNNERHPPLVSLYGADLIRADLIRAILNGAILSGAILIGAILTRAYLYGAILIGAILIGAILTRAYLTRAYLTDANLSGADLSNALLWCTIFAENDLSTVKGLVEINHHARSYISLDSIKLPQDGSALHFLRGAGIPDEWIDVYQSMMMKPIQYHSCFISVRLVSPKPAQAGGWAGKEKSFYN